jgi:hypothetical protein
MVIPYLPGSIGRASRARVLALASLLGMVFCAGCDSAGAHGESAKPAVSAAVATPAKEAPAAASAAVATPSKFGAPLGASPVVALTDIIKDTGKYAKTTVKTEGKVTAVCQAAGCWMEISDGNGGAHIRMSGHSFLVPKTASGRRARVEGTVLPKPDNGECEQEALEATGKTVKVELDATGVELL